MSAILHSIATSIENDRISNRLNEWFVNANLLNKANHKEKFDPTLKLLSVFCRCRQEMDVEPYYEDHIYELLEEGLPPKARQQVEHQIEWKDRVELLTISNNFIYVKEAEEVTEWLHTQCEWGVARMIDNSQ